VNNDSFQLRNLSPSRYQVPVTGPPSDDYLLSIRSEGGEDLMTTDTSAAPKPLDARQAHRYRGTASDESGHFTMHGFPSSQRQ
jgi:hypothetical protein